MFTNYLKIAWRNLIKNRGFSTINVLGLAIGLSTCILIALYVVDELSFDSYHVKGNRIYRLNNEIKFGGTEQYLAQVPDALGPVLKQDYPQVENVVRFFDRGPFLIKKKGDVNNIREEKILFTDSSVFDVFTFPLVAGDRRTALNEVNSIVINESTSKRYYGQADPMGQVLTLDDKKDYKITGVMKDIPANSHFTADFFVSMSSLTYQWNDFMSNNFNSYVLLKQGTNPSSFNPFFDQVILKYVSPQLFKTIGTTITDLTKSDSYYRYNMIPLKDIHLKSKYTNELGVNADIRYVYIFSVIALFVMIIACINFMNLSTAMSAKRAKEIGIRKVMGSLRTQLMVQFFSECVVLAFVSLFVAIALVTMLLPTFNAFTGKDISFYYFLNVKSLLALCVLPLIVGIFAGSYPAIFLSSFEPIKVLKGKLKLTGGTLRNGLVTFQFAASIALIIGTFIVYRQIDFIQGKKLGFDKEHVVIINDAYALNQQARNFKEEVIKMPGILSGTLSGYLPTPSNRNNGAMFQADENDQSKGVMTEHWDIDEDYIKTLGMELVQGRSFSKEFKMDSTGVILNEAAVHQFGFNDPLNKKIKYPGNDSEVYHVIGVVKDFHFESMRDQIGPVCLFLDLSRGNVSFRLEAKADIKNTIKQIESKWNAMAPGQPFSYTFMDESFIEMYKNEQRIGEISLAFAFITIFVACLGLFGLVTFMAESRIKEIGIRKVLGAEPATIVQLLSIDFIKLILISVLLAAPVAYFVMHRWLQDFVYRVAIPWWIFVVAGLVALVIAMITVSYQAIKAAIANPIKSLRAE